MDEQLRKDLWVSGDKSSDHVADTTYKLFTSLSKESKLRSTKHQKLIIQKTYLLFVFGATGANRRVGRKRVAKQIYFRTHSKWKNNNRGRLM